LIHCVLVHVTTALCFCLHSGAFKQQDSEEFQGVLLEVLSEALRDPRGFRGNAVDETLGLEFTETCVPACLCLCCCRAAVRMRERSVRVCRHSIWRGTTRAGGALMLAGTCCFPA
jgi:hypothetical protein